MKKQRRFRNIKRSIILSGLLVGLAGSAAFAVLQSQQDTLTGNTISTATANLQLSTDGIGYSSSRTGFDFSNIIPGGAAQPITGYPFYLKNAGATNLTLKLAVTSAPSNPNNVDLGKVNVILTQVGTGADPQSFSLQSLIASGGVSIANMIINAGATQQYKLQVSMAVDAFVGGSASLGDIDFAFTGYAQ